MPRIIRASRLLIAVAVLLALSHVCALPGHAHGEPATSPHATHGQDTDGAHEHSAPAGDGSHLESCEGLRSAPVSLVIAPVAMPASLARPAGVSSHVRPHPRPSLAVAAPPPLFLLHAALLI